MAVVTGHGFPSLSWRDRRWSQWETAGREAGGHPPARPAGRTRRRGGNAVGLDPRERHVNYPQHQLRGLVGSGEPPPARLAPAAPLPSPRTTPRGHQRHPARQHWIAHVCNVALQFSSPRTARGRVFGRMLPCDRMELGRRPRGAGRGRRLIVEPRPCDARSSRRPGPAPAVHERPDRRPARPSARDPKLGDHVVNTPSGGFIGHRVGVRRAAAAPGTRTPYWLRCPVGRDQRRRSRRSRFRGSRMSWSVRPRSGARRDHGCSSGSRGRGPWVG